MREVIDRILDGKFIYESGRLEFSESRIEIRISAGEDYEGSFHLFGDPGKITKGFLHTSDDRMECLTKQFSGAGEEIGYRFHGKGMEAGDVLQGNFYVVSNQGEYMLPFVVMVSQQMLGTSMGAIKNLFHFANLAKGDWAEAVQLFYDPGFEVLFEGSDRKYKGLYRGLSKYYGNERNVEEFLIAIHKKQTTNYIIDEDKLRIDDVTDGVGRHEVLLTKNGWGYTRLQVEIRGEFLSVDKAVLSDDDFLGDRCLFYYYVDKDKLHRGINFGSLRFYNSFMEVSVPIEVRWEDEEYKQGTARRRKQELLVRIMEYYGAFRMKKISTRTWLAKNYEIMEEWTDADDADPEPKLYRAHLLITEGRTNEAGGMLDQARNAILQSRDMDNAIWCYYLYLSTLRGKDEHYVNKIAEEVAASYEKDAGNWRLGWLLLYLSPEYGLSYVKKWMFIKQQFTRGCCSPVFYIEALLLIKAEPSLFMELGDFEMQMLRYAARHELMTDEIIMQLHYLVPRVQGIPQGLLGVLKKSYDMRPDAETLHNICTLLIRENRRGSGDFPWYAAGVEENLRITKLYEYYMYSLDMNELIKLPKVIYMYFAYHNNLDWIRSGYLYASLVQNRDSLPDLYEKERFHIQEFVIRMIQRGLIDQNLAFLYKKVITGDVMLEEAGEKLAPLLFSARIRTADKRMRKLVLLYNRELAEKSFILSEGEAIVPLYGEEYTLLLEDGDGNRYMPDESFAVERLYVDDTLLMKAQMRDVKTISLQMYLCGVHAAITEDTIRRYESLIASDEVSTDYKRTVIPGMAQYYYDHDNMEELDAFLENVQPFLLDAARRGEIIRYLVLREKQEKALEWIRTYGVNGIDPKILMRLCSRIISSSNQLEDKTVAAVCFYAFQKGKTDAVTLEYLMEYYQGSTKILRDIWKTASQKGMDVHNFSERILLQMLYTGCFVGEAADIFAACIERDADILLEKAFLSQCSYDYFVKDKVTEPLAFEELGRLMRLGEQVQRICVLAYLRYYAENRRKLRGEDKKTVYNCLQGLVEDGILLPCFLEYTDICPFMRRFSDKTMLEHRTKPGRKAFLYYLFEADTGEEYRKTEMKEIYEGIFSSMFVLFFGEKLLYYISEEYEDENGRREEITGSGSISCGEMDSDVRGGRYHMLNDIVIAEALQDYDTLDQMLLEYEKTDAIQNGLFRLCE